jgi:hypothetical protein
VTPEETVRDWWNALEGTQRTVAGITLAPEDKPEIADLPWDRPWDELRPVMQQMRIHMACDGYSPEVIDFYATCALADMRAKNILDQPTCRPALTQ